MQNYRVLSVGESRIPLCVRKGEFRQPRDLPLCLLSSGATPASDSLCMDLLGSAEVPPWTHVRKHSSQRKRQGADGDRPKGFIKRDMITLAGKVCIKSTTVWLLELLAQTSFQSFS